MALATAALFLILAAGPGEGVAAPRTETALPEPSSFYRAIIDSLSSDDARSPQAGSEWWGHGLQLAQLKLDGGKLSEDASRAVGRWPAAQKADPAWDWVRVLVFLAQTALIAQGYDPGRPNGVMGPKTMLALIAWSAVSGPPMNGKNEMSYIWGLDGNVAHLLHGTLEAMGLSPGPKNRFLGPESETALKRWDGKFRLAAMMMPISKRVGMDIVMNELGAARLDDSEKTEGRSAAQESTDRSRASGQSNPDCVKFSWHEKSPLCDKYVAGEGQCRWILIAHNRCGYEVLVYFLGNFGLGRSGEEDWHARVWLEQHMIIGENWDVTRPTGSEGVWDLPEGVRLELSYCVNRYDAHFGARATRLWEGYRNEEGVGAVNTQCLSDE